MQLITHYLEALGYQAQGFDINDIQQLQSVVNWLENAKIRHYAVEDRQQLKSTDQSEWNSAMAKFADDLGCPHPWDSGKYPELVIQWLLQYAVGLEYADNAEQYNEIADNLLAQAPPLENWVPPPPPPFKDIDSEQVAAKLQHIKEILKLDTSKQTSSTTESIEEILAVIQHQLLPAVQLVKEQQQHSDGGTQQPTTTTAAHLLSSLPLGFTTGDPTIDQAATVLRSLFVQDLRRLQTEIDDAIEEVQAVTANPRTTAAQPQGEVGDKRKTTAA